MDERDWLAERFEEHRSHLRAVAYRMLGSLSEADDAVRLRPEVDRQAAMSLIPNPSPLGAGRRGHRLGHTRKSPSPCAQGRVPSGRRFQGEGFW